MHHIFRFFFCFCIVGIFSLEAKAQTSFASPDSLWGNWTLDTMVVNGSKISFAQVKKEASMCLLANGLMIRKMPDQPDAFFTYQYDGKNLRVVESKQLLPIQTLSRNRMVIFAKENDQMVTFIYLKK